MKKGDRNKVTSCAIIIFPSFVASSRRPFSQFPLLLPLPQRFFLHTLAFSLQNLLCMRFMLAARNSRDEMRDGVFGSFFFFFWFMATNIFQLRWKFVAAMLSNTHKKQYQWSFSNKKFNRRIYGCEKMQRKITVCRRLIIWFFSMRSYDEFGIYLRFCISPYGVGCSLFTV